MTFNSLFYLYNNLGLGLLHRLNRIALSTKQLQNTWLTKQMARTNEEEGRFLSHYLRHLFYPNNFAVMKHLLQILLRESINSYKFLIKNNIS